VKARRRREVRLPGKEEDKKVLSSISTCFPRRWKWRPAQRITGVLSLPHRFANKEVILDLTIDHSIPTEPPLRSIYLCLSFFRTYPSNQKAKIKNLVCDLIGPKGVYSTHSPVSRTAQVCDSVWGPPSLLLCPLSVHTVIKAEEGWAAGTTSPLSHTSIKKQV